MTTDQGQTSIDAYLGERRSELTMIRAQGDGQMDTWQLKRLDDGERQLAVIEAAWHEHTMNGRFAHCGRGNCQVCAALDTLLARP